MDASAVQKTLDRLKEAQKVVAFTGAGISAESGILTFRDSGGLWEQYSIEEVATPQAFYRDPEFVWNFYLKRRNGALKASPNAAHHALAEWEKRFPFAGVVTQNIDDLHARAGSMHIQELHGNVWKTRCLDCGIVESDRALEFQKLPSCRHCGGLLRPHVVWFGEELDADVVRAAVKWMHEADVIFVVGTSGVVEPAASFVRTAKLHGAFIVEVNVEPTELSHVADISLFSKAGAVFGEWLQLDRSSFS